MSIDWTKVKNFDSDEFDDPTHPGSWINMSPQTIYLLDVIRDFTDWPIITHNKHGIRGCVCVEAAGHACNSRHYIDHPCGCSAVDFHFDCTAKPRDQAMAVLRSGFPGIGIYYDWSSCDIGFHVDYRSKPQVWRRVGGDYIYLL
jgi:hypothetical protein